MLVVWENAVRALHTTRRNCKGAKNLFAMQSFTPKLLADAVFMEHIKVKTDTFYALAELVNKLTS